ncbi:hypothetical protein OBBRIDRAFT_831169 [Obba rivulosa]|uniref:Uncharacterized protein n=1 Tax=Obba rivulosa TaxID=1052685 RepID=A0A8E2J607_9APHY|nr:hypothetical protein OBBRIDRAFT_831169 [Obba rivulosa]
MNQAQDNSLLSPLNIDMPLLPFPPLRLPNDGGDLPVTHIAQQDLPPPLHGVYATNASPISLFSTLSYDTIDSPHHVGPPPEECARHWVVIHPTRLESAPHFPWILDWWATLDEDVRFPLAVGDDIYVVGACWGYLADVAHYLRGHVVFHFFCGPDHTQRHLAIPRYCLHLSQEQEEEYQRVQLRGDSHPPPKPNSGWKYVRERSDLGNHPGTMRTQSFPPLHPNNRTGEPPLLLSLDVPDTSSSCPRRRAQSLSSLPRAPDWTT